MQHGQSDAQLQVFAWATPNPGMSLDELIQHMAEIGNTVLEVDRPNNRLKMIQQTVDLTADQAQSFVNQMEQTP